MGLALDEPTGNEQFVIRDGDIPVILDEKLKLYMQEGALLTVDYRESRYGSGFTVMTDIPADTKMKDEKPAVTVWHRAFSFLRPPCILPFFSSVRMPKALPCAFEALQYLL
jgi:hypothetical protein